MLHDLHESVPYLYDNTVGDGPYNAWIDPMLADEWQMMGWNNVSEMTKFGMPGVFTHGTFDTWSPSYLMFIAATHNGISRLYETFGNGGADTEERTLRPNEYARTWFKQNPPLPKAKWSQRNNNNYEETGAADGARVFLGQQQAVPAQFLSEGQALHRKADDGGSGGVRLSRPTIRGPARRPICCACCRIRAAKFRAPPRRSPCMMPAQEAPARGAAAAAAERDDATDGDGAEATPMPQARREKPKPEPRTFPAGQLRPAHGSAVQPHRRYAARLSILGRRTIRRRAFTTTPAGPSASWATCRWRA